MGSPLGQELTHQDHPQLTDLLLVALWARSWRPTRATRATLCMALTLKPPLGPVETGATACTVLVTGATGYVAGSIVQRLLAAGHTVHATCRAPEKESTVGHLKALPGATERLVLFKADLLLPDAFDEAVQGCTYVFHTASPVDFAAGTGAQAQAILVDPAVKGAENVLNAVNKCSTVKRVVLTSSIAAVAHSGFDQPEGYQFTEEDWNTVSSLYSMPYSLSKVSAEKRAWEMAKTQSQWDLVAINPGMVLGPPLSSRNDGESIALFRKMFTGEFFPACPAFGTGWVDVRDVAVAHCLAAFTPSASGRYITVCTSAPIYDLVQDLAKQSPQVKRPLFFVPKWLGVLVGPLLGVQRDALRASLGTYPQYNAGKLKKELKMEFIPLTETLRDMAQAMAEFKLIKLRQ